MTYSYFIQTFGCAQNVSDSQRIAAMLEARGMKAAKKLKDADHVIINTCMIREKAENRVYGLVNNLVKQKLKSGKPRKIVVTGCMVGMAVRDKSGKFLKLIRKKMPSVDEFLPIEEVGFDHDPIRTDRLHGLVPISNGCNNFCTFCVVPFTRGREMSRPYDEVLHECLELARLGYKKITLLGMNVNSYGADLVVGVKNVQVLRDIDKKYFQTDSTTLSHAELVSASQLKSKETLKQVQGNKAAGYRLPDGRLIKPVFVKHLNRLRIPTLFPYLLEDVCKIAGIESVDFISSNPWDFSEELIEVIACNPKISRKIHLPVQSGSNSVLKRMNRWYSRDEYLTLVANLKFKIKNLKLSTDIIVGFCEESEKEFQETVELVKKAGFYKAYIAMYSDRPMTAAHKALKDNVPHIIKKERWEILEKLINIPNLKDPEFKN